MSRIGKSIEAEIRLTDGVIGDRVWGLLYSIVHSCFKLPQVRAVQYCEGSRCH